MFDYFRMDSRIFGGNPIYEVMLITLVTAAISYFNPFTRKSAQSMIQQLFDRCEDQIDEDSLCDQNKALSIAFGQLLWALIFKFVITIFTFGIKVPCGLFVPSIGMEQSLVVFLESPLIRSSEQSKRHPATRIISHVKLEKIVLCQVCMQWLEQLQCSEELPE